MHSVLRPSRVEVAACTLSSIQVIVLLDPILIPKVVPTFLAELPTALQDLKLQNSTLMDGIHNKIAATDD